MSSDFTQKSNLFGQVLIKHALVFVFTQVDDDIILLERINDEWLKGQVNHRIGRFPAAFVKVLTPLPQVLFNSRPLLGFKIGTWKELCDWVKPSSSVGLIYSEAQATDVKEAETVSEEKENFLSLYLHFHLASVSVCLCTLESISYVLVV